MEEVVGALDADVFALSCWTANRRGVGLTVKEIRRRHPNAHIVVGGPHATPLPREVMRHYPEIDTLCAGESEASFMELVERLARGASTKGIAGTWYREGADVVQASSRDSIRNSPRWPYRSYFDTNLSVGGCPGRTIAAPKQWGRGFAASRCPTGRRLEQATARARVKMCKHDTPYHQQEPRAEAVPGFASQAQFCGARYPVDGERGVLHESSSRLSRLSLGVDTFGSPASTKARNSR